MNDQEREGAFEPRRASIVTPRSQAIVPTPSLHRGFCDTSGSASSSRSTARLTAQSLWKKRRYFVRLGLAVREALRLHKRTFQKWVSLVNHFSSRDIPNPKD